MGVMGTSAIRATSAADAVWFDQSFAVPILARIASANYEAGLSATWTCMSWRVAH